VERRPEAATARLEVSAELAERHQALLRLAVRIAAPGEPLRAQVARPGALQGQVRPAATVGVSTESPTAVAARSRENFRWRTLSVGFYAAAGPR
jgi:hypothetical protein